MTTFILGYSFSISGHVQTTPLVAGLAVGAAAYGAKAAISAWQAFSKAGPRMRQFYKGGFLPEMTRREAALILGEAAGWSLGQEAVERVVPWVGRARFGEGEGGREGGG